MPLSHINAAALNDLASLVAVFVPLLVALALAQAGVFLNNR